MQPRSLAVVGLLLVTPAGAHAAVAPDARFGSGGGTAVVRAPLTPVGYGSANAAAAAPDGSVVVAGTAVVNGREVGAVRRYASDGSPVAGFGAGGVVRLGAGPGSLRLIAAAVRPDGRIVVAGTRGRPARRPGLYVARLRADGRPDPSFGGGDGIVEVGRPGEAWRVDDAALDAQGRLTVALERTSLAGLAGAVLRLRADGTPDASFGPRGLRATGDWLPVRLAVGGGRTAVLLSEVGAGSAATVLLLGQDGLPVAGFGTAGRAVPLPTAQLAAVALIDGAVEVGGSRPAAAQLEGVVARLDATGAAVPGATIAVAPPASTSSQVRGIAAGPRGALAVTGDASTTTGSGVLVGVVDSGLGSALVVPVAGAVSHGNGIAVLADGSTGIAVSAAAFAYIAADLVPTARAPRVEAGNGGSLDAVVLGVAARPGGAAVVPIASTSLRGGAIALDRRGRARAGTLRPTPPATSDVAELDAAVDGRGRLVSLGIDLGTSAVVVQRALADGAPDASFGTGGRVDLPAALGSGRHVAVDGRGRVLVALDREYTGPRGALRRGDVLREALVVRLDAAGRLDPAFGSAGVVPMPRFAEAVDAGGPVVVRADGTVVATVRRRRLGSDAEVVQVVGLTPRGRLAARFGAGGLAALPAAAPPGVVRLVADGNRVVALARAGAGAPPVLARLRANGRPDAAFGVRGVARLTARGLVLDAVDVALRPDRSLVVVAGARRLRTAEVEGRLALLGVRADGRRDPRIGPRGLALLDAGAAAGRAVAATGDGRLLVAGVADGAVVVRRLRVA